MLGGLSLERRCSNGPGASFRCRAKTVAETRGTAKVCMPWNLVSCVYNQIKWGRSGPRASGHTPAMHLGAKRAPAEVLDVVVRCR